jgi:hypothetical protein
MGDVTQSDVGVPSSKAVTYGEVNDGKMQQNNFSRSFISQEQRPEQIHYYTISRIIETAIQEGDEMFFSREAFDRKLKSLERNYFVPFEVSNKQPNKRTLLAIFSKESDVVG